MHRRAGPPVARRLVAVAVGGRAAIQLEGKKEEEEVREKYSVTGGVMGFDPEIQGDNSGL